MWIAWVVHVLVFVDGSEIARIALVGIEVNFGFFFHGFVGVSEDLSNRV